VVVGEFLVEALAQGRELQADLGGRGQLGPGERRQQPQVLVPGRLGLLRGQRVLAEVVDRDGQTVVDQALGRAQRVGGGGARDEPPYHVPADRGRLHQPLDPR
jgi:hypothetical protein